MKVFAPGKLILSGEHAVVHGKPALAMAVNRYVTATASKQFLPFVSFDLSDFSYRNRLSVIALRRLKSRIKEKYQRFVHGDFKVRDVLQKPVELAQFALMLFFDMLNIKLTQGIKIHIRSDIPIGCGMGSSAATILSIVHALAHHLNVDLSPETFFRLGLEAENMQHGFSSGLDVRVSLHGGCLYVNDGKIESRTIPNFPMFLINTGSPTTTTGESVSHAAPFFKSSSIGDDFAVVTQAMDAAFQQHNMADVMQAIRDNHHLLVKIGVVPLQVQNFISEIHALGGAAKICGAGAISGDQAGMVLVMTSDADALMNLCTQYHYDIIPIAAESRGVHVA
jgi:mevalonate kinase